MVAVHEVLVILLVVSVISVFGFPDSRVVNGTNSDIRKYPFVVSLRGSRFSHSCGGSIISPRYILTAAHCVDDASPNKISIQYASTVVSPNASNVIQVKRIVVHEDYDSSYIVNDVALLELAGMLIYNYKTIAPVTLPDPYFEIPQLSEGVPGVLVGWGRNATGSPIQEHLQEVQLKIYSDEECISRHKNETTVHNICGGVDAGGKGQCNGDSGGPLVYEGSLQVGIVSWSIKPCAVYPYPGVYTKVSHYVDWIRNNMK